MTKRITFVQSYYDNAEMLKRQLYEWVGNSMETKAQLSFIIVDDGSQKKPALPIVQQYFGGSPTIDLRLFKIVPNIPWNTDGARNLGMTFCDTEWAWLCDMDHVMPTGEAERMLAMRLAHHHAYRPTQFLTSGMDLQKMHPNCYLLHKADYWAVGGYDEDFAGWYGSDFNFQKNLQTVAKLVPVMDWHTVVYRTEDIEDANTKDWGRNKTQWSVVNNPTLSKKAKGPRYVAKDPLRFEWVRQI